jgi:glycosyltransferase involved in cell wall biosynthesis
MKISIITVTYNSEKYIKFCMDSVFQQTYKDVEYIVIDGNSSDNTLEIVKSYDKVRYMSEADSGIYDAINKGIKMASGELIGVLNSDDFFADSNVLTRIVTEFEKAPNLEAVFADVLFVKQSDINKSVRYYSSKGFQPGLFRFGFQPAHPTFYVKKEVFDRYGYYRTDLKIAGDFELLLRFLYIHKINYKYVNDLWVKMRIGGVSTSGFKSIAKINTEIIKACKLNRVYTNPLLVYSKYTVKWLSFFQTNK